MSARTVACTCLFSVALAVSAAGQDLPRPRVDQERAPRRLLDVAFVPQTEALCGGAAAAMVLRYWGATDVHAEDFASLVDDRAEGISVRNLSRAIADRGWRAMAFSGTAVEVRAHLDRGRPIVVLIEDRPGRYHYVVVVAWTAERVVLHDPATGPYRIVDAAKFDRVWGATGHTTLLLLPPDDRSGTAAPTTVKPLAAVTDACSAPLHEVIRLVQQGDLVSAEGLLGVMSHECTGVVRRELAGIRFVQERWPDAERLAEEAVRHDPLDRHAWQLLAVARFLQGNTTGALQAWNQREEPRVDLARIEGLERTRHGVVADRLDAAPDDLLTDRTLARARRRVAALPAIATSRVSYTPRADGRATIDVAVLEKPLAPRKWPAFAAMGVHAAFAREVRWETANALGDGELWMAAWRWWSGRPRVSVGLATPRLGRATGLWRLEGSWEQERYRSSAQDSQNLATDPLFISERRRAGLSFGDWASGDLRWEISGALDRWTDRGTHASAGASIERRWFDDRLALRSDTTIWRQIAHRAATFETSALSGAWRSAIDPGNRWTASAGIYAASAGAPLDLWPATDTGSIRPLLLRAHPLLRDGAIHERDVSRVLAHATVELQQPLRMPIPTRTWWAAFVDVAKRGMSREPAVATTLVDVGIGLRVDLPGAPYVLRMDVARGLRDGRMALSAGWEKAW